MRGLLLAALLAVLPLIAFAQEAGPTSLVRRLRRQPTRGLTPLTASAVGVEFAAAHAVVSSSNVRGSGPRDATDPLPGSADPVAPPLTVLAPATRPIAPPDGAQRRCSKWQP